MLRYMLSMLIRYTQRARREGNSTKMTPGLMAFLSIRQTYFNQPLYAELNHAIMCYAFDNQLSMLPLSFIFPSLFTSPSVNAAQT